MTIPQRSNGMPRPLKSRMMRSLTILIIIVMLIVTVAVTLSLRLNSINNTTFIQQITLSDAEARIQDILSPTINGITQIAVSSSAQTFAQQTVTLSGNEDEIQTAQAAFISQLTDLTLESRGSYDSVRYVLRTGSVWTELTWDNDTILVNDGFQLHVFDDETAPELTEGLRTEAGTVRAVNLRQVEQPDGSQRPVLTLVTPITRPNDLNSVLGVIAVDLDATRLINSLTQVIQPLNLETQLNQQLFLLDANNNLLADSSDSPLRYLNGEEIAPEHVDVLSFIGNVPGPIDTTRVGGPIYGNTQVVAVEPIPDLNWRLATVASGRDIFFRANQVVFRVFLLNAIGAALLIWLLNRALSRNLGIVGAMGERIQQLATLASPDAAAPATAGASSAPRGAQQSQEEAEVYHAAQQIADHLEQLNQQIDQQSERYNRNLKVAARISRETAMLEDLDTLLTRAIDLICSSFGVYHAQVFLIDDAYVDAVLAYSHGEAGQKLLEQGHKLRVGSRSVIGRVTASGQPVVVNDTVEAQEQGKHAYNPILKDTRAEMALPLQIGDLILGALDLQSNQPNAFRDDEMQTYQLVADQIAIAIYKTRLLRQSQDRIEQIETLNRQLTQMAWEELEREIGLEQSYRYNLLEVSSDENGGDNAAYTTTAEMLAVPIRIRGEVIGTLSVTPQEGMTFTRGDRTILKSVSERVGLAVETARLFQETQSNLAETSRLYETSRYLNEAETLEDILGAMIQSALPGATAGQIGTFDDYPPEEMPQWMQWAATWFADSSAPAEELEGLRLPVYSDPMLAELASNQISLVEDVEHDQRLQGQLKKVFEMVGAKSVVFIPLSVRGSWRGAIMISFPEPRTFTEREGRVYSNLIDQAGVAIDNRLLLRQTEDALMQNERLYAGSRIINQAQDLSDLVRAAVATSNSPHLNFGLAVLEGELDAGGWSQTLRHVAQSHDGQILPETDRIFGIHIEEDSLVRQREPQVVQPGASLTPMEIQLLDLFRDNGDTYGVVFPMFSANQPIALFFVTQAVVEPLSEEDLEIYRALTGQMGTVIQNRRLLERSEAALDETRRLYEASQAIVDAQDLDAVYKAAARYLSDPVPSASRINILLAGPEPTIDAAYLDTGYSWTRNPDELHPIPSGTRFSSNRAPFGSLTADNDTKLMYMLDLATDLADYPKIRTFFEDANGRSVIIAPLASRQNWLGVLTIESQQVDAFDQQVVRFVDALADQITIAIENQMLFEAAQQEARQALALAEASQLASQVRGEFAEALDTLFARVSETAGYDRWLLMLLEGDDLRRMSQRTPQGVDALAPEKMSLVTAEHSLADAIRVNRSLVINNPLEHPTFSNHADLAQAVGKHIAAPILVGENIIGGLVIGRSQTAPDMAAPDETLINTLAAQVAVTVENRRLFVAAESERTTLRSILDTLPAGVLVLDGRDLKPIQTNDQVHELLKQKVQFDLPFSAETYDLYRTGTNLHYPKNELPIEVAQNSGQRAFADDISVINQHGHQADLLISAAPILDAAGNVSTIVAAFENISNLRSLENTLQDNLRETISLYEATRTLSEAEELSDVLDVILLQLILMEPDDTHIILFSAEGAQKEIVRSMGNPIPIEGIPASALHNDRQLLIDDLSVDESLSGTDRTALWSLGIKSIASIPLLASKRSVPLGWMIVIYHEPHLFTPDEERFLSTLSDNAAVAIDNRYLFESTQSALRETSFLYSATTRINRVRDMDDLGQVLRSSMETLGPDLYAAYLMQDPSSPDNMSELFNVNRHGLPVDFQSLLVTYGLFRDELIFIEDLETLDEPTPFEQALIDIGGIRAFASVSLRVKGMPDGRIFMAFQEPQPFGESDLRYMNAVADSASVVIDNIFLLDQIQSTLEETSTLYQSSRSLSDATTPESILDVVVNQVIGSHVTQVFVAILNGASWEDPSATVEVVANWQEGDGINLQGITLTAEQFPAWPQLASSRVVTIDNVSTDKNLDDLERIGMQSLDTQAVSIIPLRVPARAIGAVWIGSREPYRHNDRDKRIYQAFAEQASISLEASYLLEQSERRSRQLTTSARVAQIASSILDVDELAKQVVYLIQEQFGYDHVQIFLMDDNNEYAVLRASTGEAGQQLLSINHKLARKSQSVIGQVTEQGKPIIALDTADADVVHRPNPYLPLTRSEMALPVINKGEVIGALDVQSNQPNAFTDDDIAVLTTLAAQLSVAIDNARLFNQSQERAEEMSFLFTVSTAAASAETLEDALKNVAELLHNSLGTLSVGIYLPYEAQDGTPYLQIAGVTGTDQPRTGIEQIVIGDPNNLVGTIAGDLIPLIVEDVEDEPLYLPLIPGTRSAVIVPQNAGDELVSLITLEGGRAGEFGQEALTLLLTLGGSLTAIVQNAKLLEQIIQSNEELQALDRLKSDFLANMSHELRTPLNSIIGFSRVMLKGIDGPLTEMQEQDLTTIYNSGQHLLGLINDILDSAKIAADKMDLQREYFDVRTVVEGVRSIGIGLVKEKPVDIYLEMTNNLPQAFGDEFRTRQVLLNLVSNAAKFTPEGNITLQVYTQPNPDDPDNPMIRIDVTDTGIGIAEQDLPLLFEAFRQVDSSLTRTVEGTGLGLPIAKSLVELQGGEMTVESEVGNGSTFSVTVPTYPTQIESEETDEEDSGEAATSAVHSNGSNGNGSIETAEISSQIANFDKRATGPAPGIFQQKRQILLIEDNPDHVDKFRRALQREGFEVQVANHPMFAETMASGLRPTLIVMDVEFAEGAGWGILEKIKDRDDTFDIPVIVVTESEDSEQAYQLGAYSFIERPYDEDDLVAAVLQAEQESNVDRILIIDDQQDSTRLLEQVLQEHGKYRVFAASTGSEGISLVARRQPDLIILDLRMPEMDGFAVLEELRNQPESASIPVVVVTGETTLSEGEREQLVDLEIIYKTDLNQDNYQHFIDEIKRQIARYHGDD